MLNVYLIRHGETQWNADGNRYCGRTDIPLTEKGIYQARQLHSQLKNIQLNKIYSSPLQRAVQTAKIATGENSIYTDERIIEVDFGSWEGKTREEFTKENPDSWNRWVENPENTRAGDTGESAAIVVDRVGKFFDSVLKEIPSGNVLVVGHNGINRLFLSYKLGMELKNYRRLLQENASITMFSLDPANGELTLRLLNSRL